MSRKKMLDLPSFLKKARWSKAGPTQTKSNSLSRIYLFSQDELDALKQIRLLEGQSWQEKKIETSEKNQIFFEGKRGPVWILRLRPARHQNLESLEESPYAHARDSVGALFAQVLNYGNSDISIELWSLSLEQELGALVGIDLTSYQFKTSPQKISLEIHKKDEAVNPSLVGRAIALAASVNLCRHLVNLPPNQLNPVTYAQLIKDLFANFKKDIQVQIWDEKRLQQEHCGLHLAVGQGSRTPPRLVHLRYRPRKTHRCQPLAFVGKGITFDSGGLDIKPSSGMRLMKKDMGGSATLVGLCFYLAQQKLNVPCDFFLALAENGVDGSSFRPSDLITARNGNVVEIHNTDAEGRLVLADALDVAIKQKGIHEPQLVIDVATLTGAIKVALGADIAGLFSNHSGLSKKLQHAGLQAGDLNWPMPLYQKYTSQLQSPFADFVNAADGFGGAITAALFLEKFVGSKPWAHLDIYAWTDKPHGALTSIGGSGQGVQCLAEFLEEWNAQGGL